MLPSAQLTPGNNNKNNNNNNNNNDDMAHQPKAARCSSPSPHVKLLPSQSWHPIFDVEIEAQKH
jgi:hypothetical protein